MKYIQNCEICRTELRFPLDRGILLIKCPSCNHTFKMDPDDPKTFRYGRFDIHVDQNSQFYNGKPTLKNTISDYIQFYTKLAHRFFGNLNIKRIVLIVLVILLIANIYKLYTQYNQLDSDFDTSSPQKELKPKETNPYPVQPKKINPTEPKQKPAFEI